MRTWFVGSVPLVLLLTGLAVFWSDLTSGFALIGSGPSPGAIPLGLLGVIMAAQLLWVLFMFQRRKPRRQY